MMTRLLIGCVTAIVLANVVLVVAALAVGHTVATHAIAFTSERDGNSEIYLADIASGLLFNLTRSPAQDNFPGWSPDGRLLV